LATTAAGIKAAFVPIVRTMLPSIAGYDDNPESLGILEVRGKLAIGSCQSPVLDPDP